MIPKIEVKQKTPKEVIKDIQEDWLDFKAVISKLAGKEIKDCFLPSRGKCRESCALWLDGVCSIAACAYIMTMIVKNFKMNPSLPKK